MTIKPSDLVLDDGAARAYVRLEEWADYAERRGLAANLKGDEPGNAELVFAPEGREDAPIGDEEFGLVEWFWNHRPAVQHAAIDGLLREYPKLQDSMREFLGTDFDEVMPNVSTAEGFKDLIGIGSVYIHRVVAGGVPYVGLLFGCTWDREHGLGVLMHGTRVVEVGGADTAFLLWKAERDARERR